MKVNSTFSGCYTLICERLLRGHHMKACQVTYESMEKPQEHDLWWMFHFAYIFLGRVGSIIKQNLSNMSYLLMVNSDGK